MFADCYFVLIAQISFAQVIQTNPSTNAATDMQRLNRIDDLVNSYISKNRQYRPAGLFDRSYQWYNPG